MVVEIVTGRLLECERVIERGLNTFVEVGAALLEIRDSRLYKDNYSTFESYCQERWGMSKQHAFRLMDGVEVIRNLSPMGDFLPSSERQIRPLVGLPQEQQFQVWQQVVNTAPEGKITSSFVQEVVEKVTMPHVSHNSGVNEWYTPPEYIQAALRVMGRIDLDPASSEIANGVVKATLFYTAEDDGLSKFWAGKVWMNPPYASELVARFVIKFVFHVQSGDISEGMVLVNNATETNWFEKLVSVSNAVVFPKGRVRFLDPDGNPGAPLQGQAVLYVGPRADKFIAEFGDLGWAASIC
jgi:DNA N-6-adenine-methyltransferase (Dam).